MAKEWEESKHPRDDNGKFTDGAGKSKLEKANEIYLGWENELDLDDKETSNPVTIRQAKKLFSEGKNIWGDPLPKKK